MTWNALWLLPLLPLLGSVLCGVLHFRHLAARRRDPEARLPHGAVNAVACGALAAALVLSLTAFVKLLGHGAPLALESSAWPWIDAGRFSVDVSLVVDRLSAVMILVVTGVGFLIHVYSTGYMHADPGYAKFFAYMNLFVFAMLVLVLSSSLVGLFVGWEGVGLCSYLLIGFWYEKGWPAEAGQKAFVVNRIGDACFLLGTFLLLQVCGTLDLSELAEGVPRLLGEERGKLALAALLLFGGACGKSAQVPLFTWLPDAMAGPTPVSALIHAATMVTAGVYLVARLNPLFAASPAVLLFVGIVGALTAVIGASSALLQRDIKKVLAYSTVSQLGYMFLGLSAGAWAAAIFHLVTHAFFKGLLFLASGNVIHGLGDRQDMAAMGGLRREMPKTARVFAIGGAALSGLPLLSGFFSKDEILAQTLGRGGVHLLLWLVGVFTAGLTAYYTWRMIALTFHGEARYDPQWIHPHESPRVMRWPLWVLAALAILGGLLNLPHAFPGGQLLAHWLAPVTEPGDAILHAGVAPHAHGLAVELVLLAFGAGIALWFSRLGFLAYVGGMDEDARLAAQRPGLADFLERAWKVDEAYLARVVRPVRMCAILVATLVDQAGIDAAVNGLGRLALRVGGALRGWVDGSVRSYALWMGAGAALLGILWVWS